MPTPKTVTPLDLPAPLTAKECADLRRRHQFNPKYDVPARDGSRNVTELLKRHVDASNHALLRRLARTTVPTQQIGDIISASWYREDKDNLLHNMLLLTEELHSQGILMDSVMFLKLTVGINRNMLPKDRITRITTVEELASAAAVYRFAHTIGLEHPCLRHENFEASFIANRYLDRMLRNNPETVDHVARFVTERSLGEDEEDLAPLIEYLGSASTETALAGGWL